LSRNKYIDNNIIYLSEYIESDYRFLYDTWYEDETVLGYNWKMPYSFDDYCSNFVNSKSSYWEAVIIRCEDNIIIGRIGLSADIPDLTIAIFKEYRNQQYGKMAFSLGIKYCFETLEMEKIYAGCFEGNGPSRKMIEQCGFIRNPDGDTVEPHIFTGKNRLQIDYVLENPRYSK